LVAGAHLLWHRFFGKGGEGPGTETRPQSLNSTLPLSSSHEKEKNHGQEEKEEEDGKEVMTSARASY
jgi:hypothetical protein